MWELDCEESWAPKNWCFWTVVLEKTLESPLTARRSNQSILKEISPGCSLEGLMLKLKLQCFGHLMRRVDSLEKTWCWEGLGAWGEVDDWGWDGWMASPTRWAWVWVNSGSWWWTGRPGMLWFMGSQRVRHDWATELNWTELNCKTTAIKSFAVLHNLVIILVKSFWLSRPFICRTCLWGSEHYCFCYPPHLGNLGLTCLPCEFQRTCPLCLEHQLSSKVIRG